MTDSILITGGAGFIGSHLIDRLTARGEAVVCLDNFDPYYSVAAKRDNLRDALESKRVFHVQTDIRDAAALSGVFSRWKFRTVVHLAARPGVRPSLRDPGPYVQTNVLGTLNVLKAAVETGAQRFIFASSSSVYGPLAAKAREHCDPLRPLSPYAASKVAGEALCHAYASVSGMTTIVLRFFTVYGPRQRPDMAISRFTDAIWHGRPVTVFGNGESRRDYTFIDDIIDGVEASMTVPLAGYHVFNLGASEPVQLMRVIRLLEGQVSRKARLHFEPSGVGEPDLTFADVTAARQSLGFNPQVGIEEGIARYVDWYREKRSAVAEAV